MSLPSTTVFEVRPGAGSATNGGGFVPGSSGTDWSQQNAAQYNVADGVLNSTTTVTSGTAAFGTDVVGNIAYIAGAWYQIVSRTNATTIVVDRATGTASGQTIKIGGALDLCVTAEPLLTAGMTLWLKYGTTQTITVKLTLTVSGDSTNGPITWNGYDVTRGDHTTNQPLITTSTNNSDLLMLATAGGTALSYRAFDNLSVSSTAGTPGNGFTGTTGGGISREILLSNCKIKGFKNGIHGETGSTYDAIQGYAINCEILNCTVDGITTYDSFSALGCYIHGNAGWGIHVTGQPSVVNTPLPIRVRNSVIYNNTLGGINITNTGSNTTGYVLDLDKCAVVSNGGDGVKLGTANALLMQLALQNTIIYGNGGWGVNITNTAAMIVLNRNSAYGSNTSGARNNLVVGTGDQTLTGDPFVAKSANDFTLNNTVGGGAACRAAGYPGASPGLVASGSTDIGPLQHADPAAAGGGVFASPRRIVVQNPIRAPRRTSLVIPAAPVTVPLLIPGRRRPYPVSVPARRNRIAAIVPAPPVVTVLRTPPRQITRQQFVRRNAGNALFASTTMVTNTVLVTSPRKVR